MSSCRPPASFDNIHLFYTLGDKKLSLAVRKQLGENLPDQAAVELREILFNVAVGNVDGFPAEILQILSAQREIVFKIVDANDNLSPSEHRDLIGSPPALKLLETVLPNILKVIENGRQ